MQAGEQWPETKLSRPSVADALAVAETLENVSRPRWSPASQRARASSSQLRLKKLAPRFSTICLAMPSAMRAERLLLKKVSSVPRFLFSPFAMERTRSLLHPRKISNEH